MLCLTLDHHIKLPSPVNRQVKMEMSHGGAGGGGLPKDKGLGQCSARSPPLPGLRI